MTGQGWRRASRAFSVLTALSILAGCSDEPYKTPVFSFLSSYKSAHDGTPVLLSNADWWKRFNDPTLDTLIQTGLTGNLNLDIARERVIEAEAFQRTVPTSAFLSPRAGVRREGGDNQPSRTRSEASLGFDWSQRWLFQDHFEIEYFERWRQKRMTKQDAAVVASYHGHIREDALAAVPAEAGRVLDIGGGIGASSAALKRRSQASHVVVADLVADGALPEVDRAYVGDLEDPAFLAQVLDQEGPFDTILCFDVLEHLRDPWSVVARLTAGLEPGGVMVASIPNARNIALVWPLVVYGRFDLTDAGLRDRTHLRWFTRQSAIALMACSGLEIELVLDKVREARRYRWANVLTFGLFRRFLEIQYIIRARRPG